MLTPFTDEQTRILINLSSRYQNWMEAERILASLPYGMQRKEVGGRAYLYQINDRLGNGTSLGPWSDEKATTLENYKTRKQEAKHRRDTSARLLDESARLAWAVRLPMLPSQAGALLREADKRDLLGNSLLVVGTNALAAYAIEAGGRFALPDETEDFDLAWTAEDVVEGRPLWDFLKAVDSTYSVNTERQFQARNASAYEVEILVAPSRAATMPRRDQPKPIALPEQEWLLWGTPVDHITLCRDRTAARIIVPDPRWFALHKLWLSDKPQRNPLKRDKDRRQGAGLLDALISGAMPRYPLDDQFIGEIPEELLPTFAQWKNDQGLP